MVSKVSLHTLGCKVNQYDTEALRETLEGEGIKVVEAVEQADVLLVNTCTVTASTDRQNRQLIRGLKRKNPSALMIVTGCQAEVFPEALEQMQEVDFVVKNHRKAYIPDLILRALDSRTSQVQPDCSDGAWWGRGITSISGHTRAFVKVQDGCDSSCTYCVVPRARGSSLSRPPGSILQELERMEAVGVKETVLTGVRLGLYGRDLSPPLGLVDLLKKILAGCGIPRVRLSSLEPLEISQELIAFVKDSGRICPHLHVPLQSGDDEILQLMNRPYTIHQYRERILLAWREIPDLTLGCDVIVGFPGETHAHFQRTRQFLTEIPYTYFHVFPFSPRPGTVASNMSHQAGHQEIQLRGKVLRELSQRRRRKMMKTYVGRVVSVLLERKWKGSDGWMQGLTPNYLKVRVPGEDGMKNRILAVRLDGIDNGFLVGRLLEK